MTRANATNYFTDDDSGIGLTRSSSNEWNSSTSTLVSSGSSTATIKRRTNVEPLVKVASDGLMERVRPVRMKNSANGDYILCHTDRGNFVAYRTPAIPDWITRLVEEVELLQR